MDTIKQLFYLYRQQTEEEQENVQTIERNSRGFNRVDAEFCSNMVEWILAGKRMSPKQQAALEKILPKYQRQLSDGAWKNEVVPTTVIRKPAVGVDTLDMDPATGALVFYPVTYPSKQIRLIANFYWTGNGWMQPRPFLSAELVKNICNMFPSTVVTDRVKEALKPKKVQLSDSLQNNPILFPFQKEAVAFMLSNKKALLGLAPGLGKSACAIYAAEEANAKRVLVIAPLSLMYNWQNEVKKWIGKQSDIVYKQDCPSDPGNWTIANYDTVRLHSASFTSKKWDCIIVDETILIKNRKAIRTKLIKNLLSSVKPEYVWFLSGAPTSRLYDDMWAQLNCLLPSRFSSYWKFTEKYCYVEQNQWGWQVLSNRPDAAEDLKADLSDVYFARTQDQVLDLPEWIFDDLHVRMGESQDKIYGEMEDRFIAELEDGEILLAPNVLSQLTRLVQLASNPLLIGGKDESAKWNAIDELLEYEKLPAIIWTSFIRTADRLKQKLEKRYRVGILTGETKSQERQSTVDKFQNGELDVIIAHPGVGKFGFTLTAAKTAIYLERSYNGDDYYQSLHRIRRIGTSESPHVVHLISDRLDGTSTVDSVINRILKSRRENVLKLTQGELKNMFERKENE